MVIVAMDMLVTHLDVPCSCISPLLHWCGDNKCLLVAPVEAKVPLMLRKEKMSNSMGGGELGLVEEQ